jgi:hypothetical protein
LPGILAFIPNIIFLNSPDSAPGVIENSSISKVRNGQAHSKRTQRAYPLHSPRRPYGNCHHGHSSFVQCTFQYFPNRFLYLTPNPRVVERTCNHSYVYEIQERQVLGGNFDWVDRIDRYSHDKRCHNSLSRRNFTSRSDGIRSALYREMVDKSLGAGWHCYRLLEANNQNPAPWTCVVKYLGIIILLHSLWYSRLDSFAPLRLLIFIPCGLASLLPERHRISSFIPGERDRATFTRKTRKRQLKVICTCAIIYGYP